MFYWIYGTSTGLRPFQRPRWLIAAKHVVWTEASFTSAVLISSFEALYEGWSLNVIGHTDTASIWCHDMFGFHFCTAALLLTSTPFDFASTSEATKPTLFKKNSDLHFIPHVLLLTQYSSKNIQSLFSNGLWSTNNVWVYLLQPGFMVGGSTPQTPCVCTRACCWQTRFSADSHNRRRAPLARHQAWYLIHWHFA